MSLKFDGTLAAVPGSTNWDSESDVSAIGSLVNTTPLKGSEYYYSIAETVGTSPAQFIEDITGLGFESHWGKFRFRMDNTNIVNSVRVVQMVYGYRGATVDMTVGLVSVSGGELSNLFIRYRTAAGLQSAQIDLIPLMGALPLADDTIYEFEYQYKAASELGDDGLFRVWITDIDAVGDPILVANLSDLAIVNSNKLTELRFGSSSDMSVARIIDLSSPQFSTNGNYADESETYYIDGQNGSEINAGTESAPFAMAYQANNSAVGRDTIKLVDNGVLLPQRLISIGQIAPIQNGSVNSLVHVYGGTASQHTTLLCSKDYSDESWVASGDEYYVDVSDIDTDPHRIYVCLRSDWNVNGIDALDSDAIRNAGAGIGALVAGEYAYDAVNDRVYYYPKAGETISTVHVEVPRAVTANDNGIQFDTDYFDSWYVDVKYAVGSGIVNSTNGVSSFCTHCKGSDNWLFGIATTAGMTIHKSVGSWSRNVSDGLHGSSGTGSILASIAHNNANDGISFAGSHNADCDGNLSFNNGYEGAIGDNSGIEITATAVIRARKNVCIGNFGLGVLNQSTVAAGQELEDNICAFNGGHGFNVSAVHGTGLMDGNASYSNAANAFNLVGTGDVTPANAVTADPLFTLADTTQGMTINNNNREDEDYTLQSGSPCTDTTDAGTIVQNSWLVANEAPPEVQNGCAKARRGSMGAYR